MVKIPLVVSGLELVGNVPLYMFLSNLKISRNFKHVFLCSSID